MKIVFAQGNPGTEYAHTRHNIGFLLVDAIAKIHKADFTEKTKFHAEITEITVAGEKILLVKPLTFYNETGQAARAIIDFYKCNPTDDFLVIHDDLALPFGTIRIRKSGSDAGNNGVKSLNAHLGSQYHRMRVGIFSEHRNQVHDIDFVLGKLNQNEREALPALSKKTEHFIEAFARGRLDVTSTSLNN